MPQNHARDDAPLVSRNFRLFFSRKPSPAARTECRGRGGNVKQQWRRLCLFDRREGASRGSREPTLTRPSRASGTCPAAATRRSWVSVVTLRKAGTNKTGVKRTTKEREREREGQRLRGGGHAGERARLRRLTHHRALPPLPPSLALAANTNMWRNVTFVGLPCIVGLTAYIFSQAHHHGSEQPAYSYLQIRNKDFPWGECRREARDLLPSSC